MFSIVSHLRIKRCIGFGILTALFFTLVSSLLYTETFRYIGMEDGIIENIGAVSFLLSSVVFFWLFLNIRKNHATLEVSDGLGAWFWYLILAVLFFFIAGEEISWGQRIFGWSTPEWLKDSNVQDETTIHNIDIFNAHTHEHELKPFWQSLITMNRLFSLFWLFWCFVMPLAMEFSTKVRQVVDWFCVPVPRFFHGCLFLNTFISTKIFYGILQPEDIIVEQVDEIKESFYAVIFVFVAWDFYLRWKKRSVSA